MKDACCNSKSGFYSWFCPSILGVVVGIIMMSAGASKFLGGSQTMSWVGGSVIGLFGGDASMGALATLALVLGYIAATIELLGGLSFALGCCKTSKYSSVLLAFVMASALAVHLTTLKPVDATGFQWFTGVLSQIQLPLLLLAIFVQKAKKAFTCCSTACCGSGKCEK